MFQFLPIYLVKRDEIVRACDRHSNEATTLKKLVTQYKHMRKWMVEFIRKFQNSGIKITLVNSIRITKSSNLLLFFTVFRVHCDVDFFKQTDRS